MILDFIPVGPFQMNAYLVGCKETGTGAIIDAGDEADRLLKMAENHGIQIKKILQTHGHVDHVGAIDDVIKKTKAKVYIHRKEMPIYNSAPQHGLMYGITGIQVPLPDVFISGGMDVEIGNLKAFIIETPGHTPGGVVYYFKDEGVVFVGDTLFAGSIGRTDLPGGNYETIIRSLQKLVQLPDETVVYSGHGPRTTIGEEKIHNPFLNDM